MVALAIAALLFAAEQAVGIDWPTVLISLASAGGLVAFFRLRPQNDVDRASQAKMLNDIQTQVLREERERDAERRQVLAELGSKLDATIVELAQERAASARKDLKIQILERRLEQLMDKIAALEAQLGLGGRREDDDPKSDPII